MQRQPRVDDVLDDDHVASFEPAVEILEDADLARRPRALAVARDRHEIEGDPRAHRADEVRHEHESPFEDPDEVDLVLRRIVRLDLPRERADPALDLLRTNQDGRRAHFPPPGLTASRTRAAIARASVRTASRSSVRTLRSRISTFPFTIVARTSSPRVT